MTPATYQSLPPDVQEDLPPERVRMDRSIPPGQVDVASQRGVTRMPVNAFIRARRSVRKAERRNRRAGRR